MKILQVGSSGVIGRAVTAELGQRHQIVTASRSTGEFRVDIEDPRSVENLFQQVGEFDALVCAAGAVHFAPLAEFSVGQYAVGLQSKLMGQVNLVRSGLKYLRDGGSFTLTSGPTNDDPIPLGTSSAMVNGALEGFVRGAAIELRRDRRINLVSPTMLEESASLFGSYFMGTKGVATSDVVQGYVKSVEGAQTGCVYRIGWSRDR
ncbi:short-chain dehydrogenase [Mesorhizobium loti]|uniref:Short-chain dehydrogenase n=1 Tax=Rhizobium loti TaxID=381 RepID=A0A117N3I4_RHILI|nr:short-chain dehydrogenase [Mesorhizobium loti]